MSHESKLKRLAKVTKEDPVGKSQPLCRPLSDRKMAMLGGLVGKIKKFEAGKSRLN